MGLARRPIKRKAVKGRPTLWKRSKQTRHGRFKSLSSGAKFRRQQIRQTGLSPSYKDSCKRFQNLSVLTTADTRQLYFNELTNIPGQFIGTPASGNINARTGATAIVKGISLQYYGRNFNISGVKSVINVALVAPKNSQAVPADGFFRDYGTSRDVNFSTGLSRLSMGYNPISTDKYNIIRHWRTLVNAGNDIGNGDSTKKSVYIKINRLLAWNDDTNATCENPIFLVWWITPIMAQAADPIVLNGWQFAFKAIVFFQDPN